MNRTHVTLAGAALLLAAAAAHADTTYRLRGEEDGEAFLGTAVVGAEDGAPTLTLTRLGEEPEALRGARLEDDVLLFGAGPEGLAGALTPDAPGATATVVVEAMNLREGPGTSYPDRALGRFGDRYEVLGSRDGWNEVRLPDGRALWGHGELLRRGLVGFVPGERTLLLRERGDRLEGVIQEGGAVVGHLVLSDRNADLDAKWALLVPTRRWSSGNGPREERAFRGYCRRLKAFYRARGIRSELQFGEGAESVIEMLEAAPAQGRLYSRIVIIGHGGWDGPTMGVTNSPYQVSGRDSDPALFLRFIEAIRQGTSADAKLFSSSCHAGGSNVYELHDGRRKYNWTHDVAVRSGRTVAGPAGYTSTEWTYRHVLAALEGIGTTKQEVHVAGPEGLRVIRPSGSLAGTPVRPIPTIDGYDEDAPPVPAPGIANYAGN